MKLPLSPRRVLVASLTVALTALTLSNGLPAYSEEMEMLKRVDEGKSLIMDINWVMQMTSFGFSGFFCELLGLSSGLRAVFPELRVIKSLARNRLVEPLVGREGADMNEENEMTSGDGVGVGGGWGVCDWHRPKRTAASSLACPVRFVATLLDGAKQIG